MAGLLPAELIERKRDGEEIPADALRSFLEEFQRGDVADYQMSAFLMAVFFRGLSERELVVLTRAMIDSGERLDFRDGGPPAVDKHSTGGVGDKVSLVLAPLLAEAGLRVPMMSGRGLGHTGGTLDKLEAIPGFRTGLDLDEFRRVLSEVGCAMIGQTPEIAPLDGRLYALRDVTGTVPSIPLIASSIVSKKVAEGIEALVLDVKCGRGAFMQREEEALALARVLVRLAEDEGVRTTAIVTEMDAPLGVAVGNALEVREAIACLKGEGPEDLERVTLALCAELLVSAGAFPDLESAASHLKELLMVGRAAARFARLVEAQGGDAGVVERPESLPSAPVVRPLTAEIPGRVIRVDAREVGYACMALGAGRRRVGDLVDPAVGFEIFVRPGDSIDTGDHLAAIHARDAAAAEEAARRLAAAIEVAGSGSEPSGTRSPDRLLYRITREGRTVPLRPER